MLVDARRARALVAPPQHAPESAGEAFAVQDHVLRELGPAGGWKVGAKTPAEEPVAAPILADHCRPSPCTWPAADFHVRIVEAEIAFRIGRDIPADGPAITRDALIDLVSGIHAAIEIVDSRLEGYPNVDKLWMLADNQSNGGFVFCPDGVPWTGQDYDTADVRLTIDGTLRVEGPQPNTGGDPARLVVWCLDHLRGRGGVRAGTWITTGSYTGMIPVGPGARVEAEFPGIGRVSLDLP